MSFISTWFLFSLAMIILPITTLGIIRKSKALLQNRIGRPILQGFFDLIKLTRKKELKSRESSWISRGAVLTSLICSLLLAMLIPWLSFKPALAGGDLFLIIYIFAFARLANVLLALDAGSPFGGLAAGRELAVSLLVEPSVVLSLTSLALLRGSTDLALIFSLSEKDLPLTLPVWFLAGLALYLSSLVELSRMPIDDPCTHLELTMIHEAMIIECSGRDLAIMELVYSLKMTVLFGLSTQCFLKALSCIHQLDDIEAAILSLAGIGALALTTSFIETFTIKLKLSRIPNFIAYTITLSLLTLFAAVTLRSNGG